MGLQCKGEGMSCDLPAYGAYLLRKASHCFLAAEPRWFGTSPNVVSVDLRSLRCSAGMIQGKGMLTYWCW